MVYMLENPTKRDHVYLIYIYKEGLTFNNIRGAFSKFPDFFVYRHLKLS